MLLTLKSLNQPNSLPNASVVRHENFEMLVSNNFENMVLNGNKGTIFYAISYQLSIYANVAVSSKEQIKEQIKNAEKNDIHDSCVIFKTASTIFPSDVVLFYGDENKAQYRMFKPTKKYLRAVSYFPT